MRVNGQFPLVGTVATQRTGGVNVAGRRELIGTASC
jgi:hypothetical protein